MSLSTNEPPCDSHNLYSEKKITLTKANMPLVFLVNKIVFILNTSLASDITRKYQDLNNLWAKD